MRKLTIYAMSSLLLLVAQANTFGQVGALDPLFDGGSVDGWSGLSVLHAEVMPAGETVNTVSYYAADVREFEVEDELYSFVPLIVRQEGGSRLSGDGTFTVHEVGPIHTPTSAGENMFDWGSAAIPSDGALYHPAFVAWQHDVDNTDGGLVSFAGAGGTGMKQFDVDTSFFAPDDLGEIEPGLELNPLTTHSSGFNGRDYQFNFGMSNCTDICDRFELPPPEPAPEGLIGTAGLRNGGSVDGWSGLTTMYGHEIPAGETVETVNYYTADNRSAEVEDGFYNFVPVIVRQEDGSLEDGDGIFSIFEVGPVHKPEDAGENSFEWGSMEIPDDGNLYHPAMVQWQDEVDDAAGGVVSFAANGGTGVVQYNVATDFYPDDLDELEPGLELTDFQTHTSAPGGREYQFNFLTGGESGPACDLDGDGVCTAADIDALSVKVNANETDADFDLNDDGSLTQADRDVWVNELMNTYSGDANLDGEFNSSDFVAVFSVGKYETGEAVGWAGGDWDGDGLFNSSDFVRAFSSAGYEQGPREPAAVPEPSSIALFGLALLSMATMRRR